MRDDLHMTEQQLNKLLKGYKIAEVRRVLNLIMFEFESQNKQNIALHVECFVKIAEENKILLSSYDLYEPKPNLKSEKYGLDDYGSTLFDYSLEKNMSQIIGREIINVKFSFFDLDIFLSDNAVIRLLQQTLEKNQEQLMIFDADKTYLWLWTAEEGGEIIDISQKP